MVVLMHKLVPKLSDCDNLAISEYDDVSLQPFIEKEAPEFRYLFVLLIFFILNKIC